MRRWRIRAAPKALIDNLARRRTFKDVMSNVVFDLSRAFARGTMPDAIALG